MLERERRRVFGRAWQWVGRSDQVQKPGQYLTCELAGEPVIVVRQDDGELLALSNVCRHRAGPVAQACGQRRSFQCGYHGWTYGLRGDLLTTPEWEGVADFDRAAQALPRFRAATFGPLVLVSLDPQAPSLQDWLGAIPQETTHLPLDRLGHYRSHDYELRCNWKVYVDNYLEGYHIPIVHPGLHRQLDYARYRTETARYHSKQFAPLRPRATDSLYRRGVPEGQEPEALYYWIFPNLMLNIYPDHLQVNRIVPLGVDRTRTCFEWYVLPSLATDWEQQFAQSFAFSDEVQAEDIAICEAVQRGLGSRNYDQGRFSVARENGVHHFHGLLSEYLAFDQG